jgi:phosphate transport system substrate-binding protein
VTLHAAGSTFAAPLYRKWFQSSGMSVGYDAVGSEEGIKQLAEGNVDFAASDMPLTAQNTPEGLQVIQVPTVLGGVVPIYNLPGLGRPLRLTPQTLAGIYSAERVCRMRILRLFIVQTVAAQPLSGPAFFL